MKVVAIADAQCAHCLQDGFIEDSRCVAGRVYTVAKIVPLCPDCGWFGYILCEYPNLRDIWCSCGFREIDGDAEAWERTMHKHRPKTKELEPA